MEEFMIKVLAADQASIKVPQPGNVNITDVGLLVSAAVSALLILAALAAFIFLVLGGLQWITSGGDKAGMEAARNKITHAIVGLIIVAAAYAIMVLVSNFLGIGFLGNNGFNIMKPFTTKNATGLVPTSE
jgi:hypothetical protein